MICPACGEDPCAVLARCQYPYTHHGPPVHGSKLEDYLISEISLIENGLSKAEAARRHFVKTDAN